MSETNTGTTVSADKADQERRGLMLVLSSPSGAGKSTIARLLLEQEDNLELSISVTTRPRRSSEVHGVHYHFLEPKQFEKMKEHDELLEWAEVHGNYYATPRGPVEEAIENGRDILFDIDIQGTFQLYQKMRADVVSVFILPPSRDELQARLDELVPAWSARLGVATPTVRIRAMKRKWGACRPQRRDIVFNLELAKQPPAAIDYVVLHELAHLLEPSHGPRFQAILTEHMPDWRAVETALNGRVTTRG